MGDNEKIQEELSRFLQVATTELASIRETIDNVEYFRDAVAMIEDAIASGNRLHVTGIGKPHHISAYFASLLSSLGIPSYLLDGTEATHGSAGQVAPGDVVVCISYYGNVPEIKPAMTTLRRNGAKLLSVTGFDDSWVAQHGDVHLKAFVTEEGDYLNKPPRTSILGILLVLMGLSIALQSGLQLDHEQYVKWHPGGQLGKLDA